MTRKFSAAVGAVALAMTLTTTAKAQIVGEPCETCGVALGAPLPEGVFFTDNESYGQRDGQANRLGVNVPITIFSTPFTFYDTRLEVLAAIPVFTHIDGSTLNRVDTYSQGLLFAFAHDFGNGFNAAFIAGPRSQDNFTQAGRGAIADIRAAFSYVKDGYNVSLSFNYGGNLGGKTTGVSATGVLTGFDDSIFVDYTLTKKFGKFELGVVGSYFQDITGPIIRANSVSIGGLIGYDFGPATVQAYVTREVEVRNGGWGLGTPAGQVTVPGGSQDKETRGFVRFIIPLYVAPAAPKTVVAKY